MDFRRQIHGWLGLLLALLLLLWLEQSVRRSDAVSSNKSVASCSGVVGSGQAVSVVSPWPAVVARREFAEELPLFVPVDAGLCPSGAMELLLLDLRRRHCGVPPGELTNRGLMPTSLPCPCIFWPIDGPRPGVILSTSSAEDLLRASSRTVRLHPTKWFVPGGVEVTGDGGSAPAEKDQGFDCFFVRSFKVLFAIFQGYVVLFLFCQGLACKMYPPMII